MSTNLYIDGEHIGHMTKYKKNRYGQEQPELRIDWGKFCHYWIEQFPVGEMSKAYYYNAVPVAGENNETRINQMRDFLTAVKYKGLTVREGIISEQACQNPDCYVVKEHQKQVDIQIALDIAHTVWFEKDVTDLILVTADSDLVPAVKLAVKAGKRVYLIHNRLNSVRLFTESGISKSHAIIRKDLFKIPGTYEKTRRRQ